MLLGRRTQLRIHHSSSPATTIIDMFPFPFPFPFPFMLPALCCRAQAIDFSAPYFFSGVSFLAAPKESTDIPLLAFLLPFSSNLWIAIFTSLHVTAAAVAIYEWLSPFGLNPWGRQRSKNFGYETYLFIRRRVPLPRITYLLNFCFFVSIAE